MLSLYRRLLALRREAPALRLGDLELLDGPEHALVYRRTLRDSRFTVAIEMAGVDCELALPGELAVALDSAGIADDAAERDFDGRLPADRALVLREL